MDGAKSYPLAVRELPAAFGACLIQELQCVLHRHLSISRFGFPGVQNLIEELGPVVYGTSFKHRFRHFQKVAGASEGVAVLTQSSEKTMNFADLVQRRYGAPSIQPSN